MWHWRTFVIGGGTTSTCGFKFWVLAYGLFQWATRLKLDSLSGVELCLRYLFLVYWYLTGLYGNYSATRID